MNSTKNLKGIMIVSLIAITAMVFGKDKIISYSELPTPIKTYINTHFPNYKVLSIETDNDLTSKEYDIKLSNGIEVEFNGKTNEIKNISADSKLPDNIIPLKIKQYVKKNYPNNFIKEWDLKKTHQTIEMNNDIGLKFTMAGDFIGIDN